MNAEIVLERLVSAVSEQQYTLRSRGWHTTKRCESCGHTHTLDSGRHWSKAGARKSQYEAVEAALDDAIAHQEGRAPDKYVKRLEEVARLAVVACSVGHSAGCSCLCCKVLNAAEGLDTTKEQA